MTPGDTPVMKEYLIEFFKFNDWGNESVLARVASLADPSEAVRLFSHLINSQNKWLNRITLAVADSTLSWSTPVYDLPSCFPLWKQSVGAWLEYLTGIGENDVEKEITFRSSEGGSFSATIRDIALQLNYHSIHHRAQIMMLLRSQGVAPPPADYILLRRRTISL